LLTVKGTKLILMDEDVNTELLDFRLNATEERLVGLENHFERMCVQISELTVVVQLQSQQLGILKWVAMVTCAALIGSIVKGFM